MAKKVYLLLTRSNTFASKAIYQLTKDEFTHVSISLAENMEPMYSFCRRYPRFALPAGFTSESLQKGFYAIHAGIPCKLYALKIEDQAYDKLKMALDLLMEHSRILKYDILGTMFCRLDIAHQRHNHRYCSWFVAELLGDLKILSFDKDYSLVRPMDFTFFEELELVYSGTVGELSKQMLCLKN